MRQLRYIALFACLALSSLSFAQKEDWRPALQAYKESLKLVEDPTNRQTYEDMRLEHGFRVIDYKIETDANEGDSPWYPDAESMRYCFYSNPSAPTRTRRLRLNTAKP